jgi:hypothetical protein
VAADSLLRPLTTDAAVKLDERSFLIFIVIDVGTYATTRLKGFIH